MEAPLPHDYVGALFVQPEVREQALSELPRTIVVRLGPFLGTDRGNLLGRLREALRSAFARRDLQVGAWAESDRASTLLYGAVSDGHRYGRMVLTFESMAPLANARGALDGEDSRVLRELLLAAETCEIALVLDPDDVHLEVFGPTMPLGSLLPTDPEVVEWTQRPPEVHALGPVEAEAVEGSYAQGQDAHVHVETAQTETLHGKSSSDEAHAPLDVTPMALEFDDAVVQGLTDPAWEEPAELAGPPAAALDSQDEDAANGAQDEDAADEAPRAVRSRTDEAVSRAMAHALDDGPESEAALVFSPHEVGTQHAEPFAIALETVRTAVAPAPRAESVELPKAPSAKDRERFRRFASELEELRGSLPLSALERLFVTAYVPLLEGARTGQVDPKALRALENFSDTFAHLYRDAAATMGHRHKLPRMVMDAPDRATRLAREHGCKSSALLYCDSLRYDLGLRVKGELLAHVGGASPALSLVGEELLWAALPTTTARQVETLIRGREALSAPAEPISEMAVLRQRTAHTVRRVRMGSRDLFKLDLVASRLHASGAAYDPEALAADTAQSIASFAERLLSDRKHRTMMYVFGDHGFTLGKDRPIEGGALPEQVLVPAYAFVLDTVH
jgi:hypothetical protein